MKSVLVVGTGLIGASVGLALKDAGFGGKVLGYDTSAEELAAALAMGAVDEALERREDVLDARADVTVLATPVLPILDWMQKLAPVLGEGQLVTDVGSTKHEIAMLGAKLFGNTKQSRFLPGHPMAGKESGGAKLAEAALFRGSPWLFTPLPTRCHLDQSVALSATRSGEIRGSTSQESEMELAWRTMVARFGAQVRDVEAEKHDEICAWVSHLPQYLSTALAALLEDTFAGDEEGFRAMQAIGGRALRETTRLGASPYSMWRDVALTNTENVAQTLLALEQRLAHVRENLKTPELREEFRTANRFRAGR
jgi:prephenate dehydrogenase